MKYLYDISEERLDEFSKDLLEISPFDIYDEEKIPSFIRNSQTRDVVRVNIKDMTDVLILLDYISTDKRDWDYEPKLEVTLPNGSIININRRGNYGHYLEIDDLLIIDKTVKEALDIGLFNKKTDQVNNNLLNQINFYKEELIKKNEEIRLLKSKISLIEKTFQTLSDIMK